MRSSTASAVGPSSGEQIGCPGLTIRHLLVPLDGSSLAECTLPWAVALARVFAARITLLRILEPPVAAASTSHAHDAVEWQIRRAEAHSQLAKLDGELKVGGLTSTAW